MEVACWLRIPQLTAVNRHIDSWRWCAAILQDAARYLQDVLTLNGSDEDAAVALDACVGELDQLRTARR